MSESPVAEMTLPVEEGGIDMEPGEEQTGTITGTEIKEFEVEDGTATYYQLNIEPDVEGDWEFTPDWPAKVTPATGLGRLCKRFGAALQIGEDIKLHELFEPGMKVVFTVGEEEWEDDSGEERTSLVVDQETLRPEGTDLDDYDATEAPEDTAPESEEDEDDDVRPEVLEYVDDHEGAERSEIIKSLGKDYGGEYVQAFKSLVDDGDIDVEDGLVFLPE